jgi:dolichyl-phosphate beta-glucosyltransferase
MAEHVQRPALSLILPAYNEVRSIGRTLDLMQAWLARRGVSYEILVSADGDDGTRELVAQRAQSDPRLSVLGGPERRGKGRGIRLAVQRACGDIIGFLDADYKVPIDEIEKILPWFERGYDVVFGSRGLGDSQIEVRPFWYRQLGSKGFAVVMRLIVGLWGIRDTQCGFKFFRHDVAKDLFRRQRIDGYMFDVEILHLAQQSGYRLKEVGITWRDDGDTRLNLVAGNWRNLLDLFRIRWGRWRQPDYEPALPSIAGTITAARDEAEQTRHRKAA